MFREIFDVKQKSRSASFTKYAGYLYWEVSLSVIEISFILKNKMAVLGISLKIYLFLLAGSHNQKVKSLHR